MPRDGKPIAQRSRGGLPILAKSAVCGRVVVPHLAASFGFGKQARFTLSGPPWVRG